MRANLLRTLVESLEPLDTWLISHGFQETGANDPVRTAALDALHDMRVHAGAFVRSVGQYAGSEVKDRRPEAVRTSVARLIQSTELYKRHLTVLCPDTPVTRHAQLGRLYGFDEPRSANIDKRAMVAQEIMLDLWGMTDDELRSFAVSTEQMYYRLGRVIESLCGRFESEESLEAVA